MLWTSASLRGSCPNPLPPPACPKATAQSGASLVDHWAIPRPMLLPWLSTPTCTTKVLCPSHGILSWMLAILLPQARVCSGVTPGLGSFAPKVWIRWAFNENEAASGCVGVPSPAPVAAKMMESWVISKHKTSSDLSVPLADTQLSYDKTRFKQLKEPWIHIMSAKTGQLLLKYYWNYTWCQRYLLGIIPSIRFNCGCT